MPALVANRNEKGRSKNSGLILQHQRVRGYPNGPPAANLPGVYPPTGRGARARFGRGGRTAAAPSPFIHSGKYFWYRSGAADETVAFFTGPRRLRLLF